MYAANRYAQMETVIGSAQVQAAVAGQPSQYAIALGFALLWGVGLFAVLEVDLWAAKSLILFALAPLTFMLERYFYGRPSAHI